MPVPVVGVDPGPDWATNIDACLSVIDSHNHSSGQGVPITPAGLNINSDLAIGGNNLTTARSVRFSSQGSPLNQAADLGCLYESGVDLYYNDGAGNQVRITQSGSVSGSAGTITGLPSGTASASFGGAAFTFQSATSTPAALNVGPTTIAQASTSGKGVTISASVSQASNYNLTLPVALPGSSSFLNSDASGNLGFVAPTGSGSVVLNNAPAFLGIPTGTITAATYSPTVLWATSNPTINAQSWAYMRIGNTVQVTGFLNATSGGSASTLASITLPISTSTLLITGAHGTSNVNASTGSAVAFVNSGTTLVIPIATIGTGPGGNILNLQLSFTYQVV